MVGILELSYSKRYKDVLIPEADSQYQLMIKMKMWNQLTDMVGDENSAGDNWYRLVSHMIVNTWAVNLIVSLYGSAHISNVELKYQYGSRTKVSVI